MEKLKTNNSDSHLICIISIIFLSDSQYIVSSRVELEDELYNVVPYCPQLKRSV